MASHPTCRSLNASFSQFQPPLHLSYTSPLQLQARLQRPVVLDIVAAAASASAAGSGAAAAQATGAAASKGAGGSASGSCGMAGTSAFAAAGAGLVSLTAGSAAGALYQARIAAKRTYLASAQGLPMHTPATSALPSSGGGGEKSTSASARCRRAAVAGPPLGLHAALRATLARLHPVATAAAAAEPAAAAAGIAPAADPTTCSSRRVSSSRTRAPTLASALAELPLPLCRRMHARWLAYAWDLLQLTHAQIKGAAPPPPSAGVTGGGGGSSSGVPRGDGKYQSVFTLSAMRDDRVKGRRLKLSPFGGGGGAGAGAGAAPPAASAATSKARGGGVDWGRVVTPAFLQCLDWHFAEATVLRCRSGELVGASGFIVRYTARTITLLAFPEPAATPATPAAGAPANSSSAAAAPPPPQGRLLRVPRIGAVFAVLLPDKAPGQPQPALPASSSSAAGAGAPPAASASALEQRQPPFTSTLLVEVWGNVLSPRSRPAVLLRTR